jgi:stalled ribosome rescue protein Dom34
MVEYELVLPNGNITLVTEKEEDLWFALKVRLGSGQRVQA